MLTASEKKSRNLEIQKSRSPRRNGGMNFGSSRLLFVSFVVCLNLLKTSPEVWKSRSPRRDERMNYCTICLKSLSVVDNLNKKKSRSLEI